MRASLSDSLLQSSVFEQLNLSREEKEALAKYIDEKIVTDFFSKVVGEIDEIMSIDPSFQQRKILEIAAEKIVKYLGAQAASIRLFNPKTHDMTAFGSYQFSEDQRTLAVPFKDSISGMVVRGNRSITVSSILRDPLYKNKAIVYERNLHSLLAVPIRIPRFMETGGDLLGSIQIYYTEDNREFTSLEVILAEVFSRRVSYVLAKKKILDLQKLNIRKENIVNKIFLELSKREGIKLKDLFYVLIPELGESMKVQSCALFSVSKDQKFTRLEAAYPADQSYHQIGHNFTVSNHAYFKETIQGIQRYEDTPYERVDPSYLLIKDPLQSRLTSHGMRVFAKEHQAHSILLVPLKSNELVLYLMMFYATEQRQYFSDEEIELIVFFGKEILKAARMELLDDIIHDFKNPAIAVAGLAGRARKLLETDDVNGVRDRLTAYLDIVVRETTRLQDLAFSMTVEGREEVLDLSRVAQKRYTLNEEAIRQLGLANVRVLPPELERNLMVYCPLFSLERVLDNILNNATKAIPEDGGTLHMRSYKEDSMACIAIRNTGEIPPDRIEQVRAGNVKGRGLNIIYRFVQANHGRIDIAAQNGSTVFTMKLPLHSY